MADGTLNHPAQDNFIDKASVAESFSRAAKSYDQVAHLQRKLGDQLLQKTSPYLAGQVMDLGAGTGYFTQQLADQPAVNGVVAADLALGMLEYASQERPHEKISWVVTDAEQLAVADNSMDLIFANLSLQWCQFPAVLFAEVQRVLKPGGVLAMTTLGPETLFELRQAWLTVDDFTHVNHFFGAEELQSYFSGDFEISYWQSHDEVIRYQELKRLLVELKGIGAQNRNAGRAPGLGGAKRFEQLLKGYQQFQDDQGLYPATYEVYTGILRKKG